MSEQHPAPAQPPRLRAVPGGTVPPLGAAPEPGTSAALVPPASAAPLTVADRAGSAARRAANAVAETVRELWLHPDRLLYVMWHGKPESMAEHRDYMKSRAWVPPGMDGGPGKAVTVAGIAYHLIVARPLKAAAKTVDAAADRPLRLLCLSVFILVLFVLLARY